MIMPVGLSASIPMFTNAIHSLLVASCVAQKLLLWPLGMKTITVSPGSDSWAGGTVFGLDSVGRAGTEVRRSGDSMGHTAYERKRKRKREGKREGESSCEQRERWVGVRGLVS